MFSDKYKNRIADFFAIFKEGRNFMQAGDFKYCHLADNNLHFYYHHTNKFKTNKLKVLLPVPLEEKTVSLNALLPFVLFRGSSRYPKTIELIRSLENLYGVDLSIDVDKCGNWQVIEFGLETVAQQFVPCGMDIAKNALEILTEIIFEPHLEEGLFSKVYLESERRTLLDDIENLKDDKMAYSLERCLEEMYSTDPFSLYKYGSSEGMKNIKNETLLAHYKNFIARTPIYVFFVGNYKEEFLKNNFKAFFPKRESYVNKLGNDLKIDKIVPKIIIEEDCISQSRLTMGFRTELTRNSEKFPHLWLANGIFGSFPHSRLFRKVREEENLAYYVFSNLESSKGLITVSAGIDQESFSQTKEIIEKELLDMQEGNITVDELAKTQKAFIKQLKVVGDNGFSLMNVAMLGVLNNNNVPIKKLIEDVQAAKIDDVIKAAQGIHLDTTFFLKPIGEGKSI